MQIKKEKAKFYQYKFEFDFDNDLLGLCREIKDRHGWREFNFSDGAWRFNKVELAFDIIKKYPQVKLDSASNASISLYLKEREEIDSIKLSNNKSKYKLRPYQEEAVKRGVHFYKSGKDGGLIVAPTASGKSIYVASIANELEGRTIVLQPSKEILEQNLKKAIEYGFDDIGVFSASCGRKDIGKITFGTIGSVINNKELFKNFDTAIIDEAHSVRPEKKKQDGSVESSMYNDFIKYFGGRVLGLTATPFRMHSFIDSLADERCVMAKFLTRTRPRIFTKIVHITQISDLYRDGFLCPIDYEINRDYSQLDIKLNSTGMDFDEESLQVYNKNKKIIPAIENAIVNNNRKHILVFCSSVADASKLSEDINKIGRTSAIVSAKTPKDKREKILENFKNGNISVVCNCSTMTTGYDFPELDTVILARPLQSLPLYMQEVGRGIRIAPDKDNVKLIDLRGNVEKFGKIENFEIVDPGNGLYVLVSGDKQLTGVNLLPEDKRQIYR